MITEEENYQIDREIDRAYEAGKKSMLHLLREAFDAGAQNIVSDFWEYFEDPDEAFNQFLKENNIEI